jgi:outer membrane protein assembly factor BamB
MSQEPANQPTRRPLRLWPGVLLAASLVLFRLVVFIVAPGAPPVVFLGGLAVGLAIVLWWAFFSRAPWPERLGAVVLMGVALFATSRVLHVSIAKAGNGMLFPILAIPVVSFALVIWAAASRRLASGPRRASLAATILVTCGVFALLRTGGIKGEGGSEFHWRWTPTPEERLLAQAGDGKAALASASALKATVESPAAGAGEGSAATPATPPAEAHEKRREARAGGERAEPAAAPSAVAPGTDWPGFRGPARDAVVPGVRIATDWAQSPPVELWRRPVGPGWSSFAVNGDLVYTQEQRGEEEVVSCYGLRTGELVWRHADAARFWESNGGAGPRGTPTLDKGRVYTFGATGILNALDAGSGARAWSRNAAADAQVKNPGWGFASSPLVVGDVVIVAASGRLAAYEAATGQPRWLGPTGGLGYSSPHLMTIEGVPQVLLMRGARTISVAPADGTLLWEHKGQPGVSIVQPARVAENDVLIAPADTMGGLGLRRLAVAHKPAGWTVEERWTSRGLKPYFNDFVVHEGHAFGFDGSILACVDLADGQRKWKGGRYGHGQLVLLPDQDLLLVLSEEGELALVKATPDEHAEVARFKAVEGKTWNHPVLVGDVLLVRNGEEMAAFRLSRRVADGR